ncbi:hypothetical protein BGW42_007765, partial [Actinomortierella wolfii]
EDLESEASGYQTTYEEPQYLQGPGRQDSALEIQWVLHDEDQVGGLHDEMGDAAWSSIWRYLGAPAMTLLPDSTICEAYDWARRASSLSYQQFVQDVRDESLSDSRHNRRLRPDYQVSTIMRDINYTVLNIEVKTPRNNGRGQIWDDVAKLGNEMKLCLDSILSLGSSQPVVLQGVVIKEDTMSVYRLSLDSEGVYVMRLYAQCVICTRRSGLFPLARMLEVLQTVKDLAADTIEIIRNTILEPGDPLIPASWMRPSFDKPTYESITI